MRYLYTLFIVLYSGSLLAQQPINGVWQGIIHLDGQAMSEGTVYWIRISETSGKVEGITREELFNTDFYALKKVRGTYKANTLLLEEYVIQKKKSTSTHSWCKYNFSLSYNAQTGYLEGTYSSSDCRRVNGKVKFYQSEHAVSEDDKMTLTHAWAKQLIDDLLKGKNAPKIRALERENFKFTPIYFDYDKAEIRSEYEAYLKKMAAIVLDHSDLRIQVTGHTDGDGSDEYNMSLSERRAKAIMDFFVKQGLREDRIQIDFKGKRNPIAPNETKEGMQLNRRVDFKFI